MDRRHFLGAASALAACGAGAQSLLGKPEPITIVVGFPPGGGTDLIARLLARELTGMWNTPIVIENRAGAASTIAASQVARQPADGRTLLLAHINSHGIAPGLFPQLGYSADRDFTSIAMIGQTPMMLLCTPTQKARTLSAIIELCRQNPGKVTFGSAGTGSAQHLALEELKARARIDVLHVPYKGSSPMLTDLMGGQIQYAFEGMTGSTPHLKGGRLIAVAQTRAKRSASYPSVPTVAEQGYPGFDAGIWFALVAPAQLPQALVERMNADVNKVLAQHEIEVKLAEYGAEDGGGSAKALDDFMKAERRRWAKLIQDAKITPDS